MKKLFAVIVLFSLPVLADQYHVYKLSNGECEIEQRDHDKMKSQRGTDDCKGHYSSRSSAQDQRSKLVKGGECKCPSGQNC